MDSLALCAIKNPNFELGETFVCARTFQFDPRLKRDSTPCRARFFDDRKLMREERELASLASKIVRRAIIGFNWNSFSRPLITLIKYVTRAFAR